MELNNLFESTQAEQNALRHTAKKLVAKWEPSRLLEGLTNEYEKSGMAILLENQTKQLIKEASQTGTQANSEEWSGVALPLVRRLFSEIASKDFVSVQPMNLPSGLVFYLDFKYGTNQPGFTTTATGARREENSVFGVTSEAGDPTGGLYGAGRFGYSINEATTSAQTLAAGGTTTSSFALSDANFDSEFSASIISSAELALVTVPTSSMTNPDMEGVRAFEVSGTGIVEYYPAYTRTNSNDSSVTFVVSGSGIQDVVVSYHRQPTDITRGDFEEGSSANQTPNPLDIPEINIEMRSEPIVAKTRKLKSIWTPEFSQDLDAYHAVDAENELTSMLSEYISQEIDLEILDMLIQNAITTKYWSATVGRIYNSATNAFENDATLTGQAYNQGTWFQTLGTKMQALSNDIHVKTMRGGANFAVVSPRVATILESIPVYAADTDGTAMGTNSFAMGVQKVGMLNSRFQVYKNPYMQENLILMGYRGTQFLETGAAYCPYVPLIMTPVVLDPDNFTPRKGVMTRYAKKMVRPEFYGKLYVEGLDRI
jgi:hypothetical protein